MNRLKAGDAWAERRINIGCPSITFDCSPVAIRTYTSRHETAPHIAQFASIKGQCSRCRLYGSDEVEDWLKVQEDRHSRIYRAVIELARGSRLKRPSGAEQLCLREALVLQRSRTPERARALAASTDRMQAFAFAAHVESLTPTPEHRAMQAAVKEGRVSLRDSELTSLLRSLAFSAVAAPLLSDLALCLLRNETSAPFIMGDAPCVFSNHYMREIKEMGVLGLAMRGLMVAMPIDERTQVLLLDPEVYRMRGMRARHVSITESADADLLNSLQVLSAQECVYFADVATEDYVRHLLAQHPPSDEDRVQAQVLRPLSPATEADQWMEALLTYERQPSLTFDLSANQTKKLQARTQIAAPRNPVLAGRLKESYMSPEALPADLRQLIMLAEPDFVVR